MLTTMSTSAMTQSHTSVLSFPIDMKPVTSLANATTGDKRHADYGTGEDLAPGGAL